MREKVKLSEIEMKCFLALRNVTFLPASFDKRFARSIIGATELSEKQRRYGIYIFNKYRKRIRNYEQLAFQLQPERFEVKVKFEGDLFSQGEADVKFKDTFKPHKYNQ